MNDIDMDDLPLSERDRILKLYEACQQILAESQRYGARQRAIRDAATLCNISPSAMRRWFDIWRANDGDPMALIDRRYRQAQNRSRTGLPRFITYWHGLCTQCQRYGGIPAARLQLLKNWTERAEIIPGYEDWEGWPLIPSGWSLRNLQRIAPDKLETIALKQGICAAAPQLAQVLATRAGLWLGSHFLFDDVWLDLYVLSGRDKGQPLQLGCLEYYTAKRVCWGQKIRCRNEETGKMIHLNQQDMRCLLALWGATIGYSPRGTTLVVENGTAAIPKEIEELLATASGGLIKVDRSGISGVRQTLKNGFSGRGVGNPRHKAALESFHNLLHNRLCHLPAATGHDRTPPETLHGLLKEEDQLIKAADHLEPQKQHLIRHYMLTMPELCDALAQIVAEINARTNHNLEGWERCGFMIEELRLSPTSPWTPANQVHPSMADQIIRTACETGADLIRRRKMSPTEAWTYEESKTPNALIKLPPWCICQILGQDMARTIKVTGPYIRIKDQSIQSEELIYEARTITTSGAIRELPNGSYIGYINPFNPVELFVTSPTGKIIGTAHLVQRVCTADVHAVEQAMGKAAGRRAQQLEYSRIIGAKTEAHILRTRTHNKRLIDGAPVTADDYAETYRITSSPADSAQNTRATRQATQTLPDISILPATQNDDSDTARQLPTVRFL